MLNRKSLESIKTVLGFNLGQVERDYLQHILLLFLYRHAGNWLVFKGGTALQKTLGLNRFSEDLDFTSGKEQGLLEIAYRVRDDVANFGFDNEVEIRKNISEVISYRIKGPLYDGTQKSMVVLRLDISLREQVVLKENIREVVPVYTDLAPYLVTMMDTEEILAEKIRAIMTRNKARDIFDARFLIAKKIPVNIELANKKLEYYDMKFEKELFIETLMSKKRIWEKELKPLVGYVPDFAKTVDEIANAVSEDNRTLIKKK
jgi:predicted nucleotidyltransferase component of viral defense system